MPIRRFWQLNLRSGFRIVLHQFASVQCRFCGGIFCRSCSKGRRLLPVKFRDRNSPRLCDSFYDMLDPLQCVLIKSSGDAAQVAKLDLMDWTCTLGWLNLPIGLSMEHEIYKASNTLRSYCQNTSCFFTQCFTVKNRDKLFVQKLELNCCSKGACVSLSLEGNIVATRMDTNLQFHSDSSHHC